MLNLKNILLIDNDEKYRRLLKARLQEEGYSVSEANDEPEGITLLEKKHYHLVISDLCFDRCGCVGIVQWVKDHSPKTKVIILTLYGSVDCIVQTMKIGAFNYILKPISPDEIMNIIEDAMRNADKAAYLKDVKKSSEFEDIIGISESIKQTIKTAMKVADTDGNVLLTGESGTGKELIAEAIHNSCPNREKNPYIAINCAAIPDSILESELFGYVKGAFTGAARDKKGLFEAADRGTLFMDEIGDTTAQFQSKLLRVIETKEIRRVGDTAVRKVDVRFIAATNKDIAKMAAEENFRADLFYRLSVVDIKIAPLRERKEDIPLLIDYFMRDSLRQRGKNVTGISAEAKKILIAYNWPGNVRELKNSIERAVVLTNNVVLTPEDFPLAHDQVRSNGARKGDQQITAEQDIVPLKEMEKQHLLKALEKHGNDHKLVAKKLGIGYTTLWRKLKELQNDRD
jgi:DNA-binding NtrC family response regulator